MDDNFAEAEILYMLERSSIVSPESHTLASNTRSAVLITKCFHLQLIARSESSLCNRRLDRKFSTFCEDDDRFLLRLRLFAEENVAARIQEHDLNLFDIKQSSFEIFTSVPKSVCHLRRLLLHCLHHQTKRTFPRQCLRPKPHPDLIRI